MRKPPLGYFSAIFGRPAEIIENALAALNRFGNRISARIDRMSEPSRRALVEEWVRSNKPQPGAYRRTDGKHVVITASGEVLFD